MFYLEEMATPKVPEVRDIMRIERIGKDSYLHESLTVEMLAGQRCCVWMKTLPKFTLLNTECVLLCVQVHILTSVALVWTMLWNQDR